MKDYLSQDPLFQAAIQRYVIEKQQDEECRHRDKKARTTATSFSKSEYKSTPVVVD